jgi:signal transduction histidine kinase
MEGQHSDSGANGAPGALSAPEHLMAMLRGRGGAVMLVAGFAVMHALLLQLGYALKIRPVDPPVMWPSAGLALIALWASPRRLWPAILGVQYLVEVGTAALWMSVWRFDLVTLYTLANMAGAVVGAALTGLGWRGVVFLRAREIVWFVLVTAIGAAVSATMALPVHLATLGERAAGVRVIELWQIWAAGQWAGIIVVAPLVASWLSPLRHQYPELRLRSRTEAGVLGALLAAACLLAWVELERAHTLLQLPTTIVLLMIVVVMRLPPRWVATMFSASAVALAMITVRGGGPMPAELAIAGIGQLQVLIVALGLSLFVLSVTLADRSITARRLAESEQRYRNFVELSTEAMWRVELSEPMPVDLSVEQQAAWLRGRARIVEFSRSYETLDARAGGGAREEEQGLSWDPAVPWVAAFEAQLGQAARQGFELDGLRFTVESQSRKRAFVAAFNGVVAEGKLQRIWGVARDITELAELNASLLRERERLKSYARQIVTAEEKARRATAVDLHDSIGQSLAGMAMTLDVARQQATPEVRLLVEEVRARLFEVQEKTRSMISDLSPPGLYELGLKAALQWLAVYVRSRDRLQVDMDVELREDAVPLDTRVLAFKLVRELLRNVVKHAGVSSACVRVRGDTEMLYVHVADEGKGFEWQLDMFGTPNRGFGLWSIADRVNEAGGEFVVDTAPGRGARFDLKIPLGNKGSRQRDDRRATAGMGRHA